jgi:hypothetical protein
MATANYTRRTPEQTVLRQAFVQQWPIVRAQSRSSNDSAGLPKFIEDAAEGYLRCGILGHGFVYAECDRCPQSLKTS